MLPLDVEHTVNLHGLIACLRVRLTLKGKRKAFINHEKEIAFRILLLTAFESRATDRPFLLVRLFRAFMQDVEQDVCERIEDWK